jgi:hypothetical protein
MIPTQLPPSIYLGMQCSPSAPPPNDLICSSEGFDALGRQCKNYACGDYLKTLTYSNDLLGEEILDAAARKKMIDWKYRVTEHYGIDREIVAISTSILDRFVERNVCDKRTFKLAAMVSIHLATKVNCHSNLTMLKMVELSRGEFTIFDLEEMECNILKTLAFKVNPPTCQSCIQSLIHLVPVSNEVVSKAIYDRATFFAELCLFDSCFVSMPRSLMATAAVLNAIEGVTEGSIASEECEKQFLSRLHQVASLEFSTVVLDEIRENLWYNYSISAQYREDDARMTISSPEASCETHSKHLSVDMNRYYQLSNSPVSVLSRKSSS